MRSFHKAVVPAVVLGAMVCVVAAVNAADENTHCPQVYHGGIQGTLWSEWQDGPDWFGLYHSSGPNEPIGTFVVNCTTHQIVE